MAKERPELPGLIKPNITPIEEFQNSVIRPIIKMQHELIIAFFKQNLVKRKVDFSSIKVEKKKSTIKNALQKDISFKKLLLGSILGHFSMDEYTVYLGNSSEYNRRIINIITKRLQDSIPEL